MLAGGLRCVAAYLVNRCDSDGNTPTLTLNGRRDYTPILEVGEKKNCTGLPKPARGGKWKPRLHPGIFVGLLKSS